MITLYPDDDIDCFIKGKEEVLDELKKKVISLKDCSKASSYLIGYNIALGKVLREIKELKEEKR